MLGETEMTQPRQKLVSQGWKGRHIYVNRLANEIRVSPHDICPTEGHCNFREHKQHSSATGSIL